MVTHTTALHSTMVATSLFSHTASHKYLMHTSAQTCIAVRLGITTSRCINRLGFDEQSSHTRAHEYKWCAKRKLATTRTYASGSRTSNRLYTTT
eukprot:9236264-Pyramimonas_sp.AAC.1